MQILCPLYIQTCTARGSTLSSAPESGKLLESISAFFKVSRLSTHLSEPPTPTSIYIGLCLSSSARPLSSSHSQNIMTDGDGAPINVSLFLFFTLLSLFPLYQCLMSWKGETVCHLLASSQWWEALKDGGFLAMLTGKCWNVRILSTANLDSFPCLLFIFFFFYTITDGR